MSNDPFAPENDPYPPEPPRMSRRAMAGLAALLPLAAACGCALKAPVLGCERLQTDPHSCRHRFCRYYRGPQGPPPED